ncbi:MAG: class I SAM-dependent methyltransferase [Candidatus Thorarchaeota archaeon]|nr:class I SAM-dependent methyltransferase [Candidatus Thorarchaeota archaeon]
MGNEFEEFRKGYEKAAKYYNLFASNEDIPFYLSFANEFGSPVLDLAAGTGRVSFELARKGFDVFAVENSSAMLAVFREELAKQESSITNRISLHDADMRNFSLGRKFPLIIIPTSFGHALATEEQLALLRCVHDHLADSGIFILDLFPGGRQPEYASFEEPPVDIDGGRTVSRSGIMKSDPLKQILSINLTFTIRDGHTGTVLEEINQKSGAAVVFKREADLLLMLSNLECVEEFGDFSKTPYSSDSGRRILVIRKKE